MFCKYSRLHLYSEYRPALRVSHQFVALAIVCNVCNGVTRYLDTTWVASPPPISHLTLAPCLVRKPSNIKIPVWCHGLLLSCHQCHLELCMNITTHFHTHNMYTLQYRSLVIKTRDNEGDYITAMYARQLGYGRP